ncbi:hypothetical protein EGW08_021744 [Elysia chlorotica]|uniref:IRF tryptophan pentad repeat domain-containing protein n=1 Tax=Elysia chlorotica TaxID=188477 RepID=A0A3S1AYH7_ELYCH|nr:hypothetical protein EGW08_021744 [Elysia chlorotica]
MPIRQSRAAGKDRRVAVPPRNMNSGVRPSKGDGSNLINTRNSAMDTRTRARQQTKQQQQQKHPRQQRQNPPADARHNPDVRHQAANGRAYAARPLRMSQWLKRLLDSGEVSGLRWENRARMEFSICWVHKSNHNFDQATHSDIFSRYAEYRGQTPKCFSTNKASFRCALNSLRDVQQLTKEGAKRGPNATRTFRFLSPSDPQYGKNGCASKKKSFFKFNEFLEFFCGICEPVSTT